MEFNIRHRLFGTVLFAVLFLFSGIRVCYDCTVVVKANQETILVGNNEDYIEPRTKIWLHPASAEAFGSMIWGFDRFLYPSQGGMNEQGLFIDILAVNNHTGWRNDLRQYFERQLGDARV